MDKYNSKLAKFVGFFAAKKGEGWAVTLGQTAYFSTPEAEVSDSWHRHEDKHKEQWGREGRIRFAAKYLWYLISEGYWGNPYEIEARATAEQNKL
jgi:hypothetical protein